MRCPGVEACHAVTTMLRRTRLLCREARLLHTSGRLPEGLDREAGILGAIRVLLVDEQDALAGLGERTAEEGELVVSGNSVTLGAALARSDIWSCR